MNSNGYYCLYNWGAMKSYKQRCEEESKKYSLIYKKIRNEISIANERLKNKKIVKKII
jgi:hypothetical protein